MAAAAPDNSRGGKGVDVVWIVVIPSKLPDRASPDAGKVDGTIDSRDSVRVTGVRSPPGFHVRQVAFYGSVPGVPTQNDGRLAVLLEPVGDRDRASSLYLLDLDDLTFTALDRLSSFDDGGVVSPTRKARSGGSKDVVGSARTQGVDTPLLSELSSRSRELPGHVKGVVMALSGARGMACAVSMSKHLMVFDLEEDEEEDEEEQTHEEDE